MSDEITLVVPAQEDFRQIAHLVVGGLGARLDLTYEDLDDLQTAVERVLACREDDGEIHVRIALASDAVRSTVGPFNDAELDELDADTSSLGLRRILETVTDGFEVERDGSAAWVVLTKHLHEPAEAGG